MLLLVTLNMMSPSTLFHLLCLCLIWSHKVPNIYLVVLGAEAATTVPPGLRHPSAPEIGCRANGRTYVDGEAVPSRDPCGKFEVEDENGYSHFILNQGLFHQLTSPSSHKESNNHAYKITFIFYILSFSLSFSLLFFFDQMDTLTTPYL